MLTVPRGNDRNYRLTLLSPVPIGLMNAEEKLPMVPVLVLLENKLNRPLVTLVSEFTGLSRNLTIRLRTGNPRPS